MSTLTCTQNLNPNKQHATQTSLHTKQPLYYNTHSRLDRTLVHMHFSISNLSLHNYSWVSVMSQFYMSFIGFMVPVNRSFHFKSWVPFLPLLLLEYHYSRVFISLMDEVGGFEEGRGLGTHWGRGSIFILLSKRK